MVVRIGTVLRELQDALYPPRCRVCGAGVAAGAPGCDAHALPAAPRGSRCGRCAVRLADFLPDGSRCAACRRSPPRFERVVSLGDYRADDGLRAWILGLKHGGRRDLADPLGRVLGARWRAAGGRPRPSLLVPVPLHPLRRFERGHDQARLLARTVSASTGAPTRSLLRRVVWTPPQGAPGARSRSANVRGAFALGRGGAELAGLHVWLVDDVVTSGATADACARTLARAGARRISVLCLARAG